MRETSKKIFLGRPQRSAHVNHCSCMERIQSHGLNGGSGNLVSTLLLQIQKESVDQNGRQPGIEACQYY